MENLEPENYKLHEGHDDDFDDDEELMDENHPMWRSERITLNSVGIDIGSAGTQVVFSRVQLRRLSEDLTSRYFVVDRETGKPILPIEDRKVPQDKTQRTWPT